MNHKNSKSIKRRKFIETTGITGIAALAGCMGGSNSGSSGYPKEWSIGTGSQGGSSYIIGSTLSSFMEEEGYTDVVQLSAVETSGTLASYRKLDQGQVKMSGTNGGFLAQSPDQGPFNEQSLKNFDKIRQIRGYFITQCFFVTKKGSGISSFSDLNGKTVLVSPSGSGLRPLSEFLLDATVGLDNIETRYSSWSDVPNQVKSGQVDAASAFIIDSVVPTSHAQQLDSTVNWKPIPFSEDLQNQVSDYPGNNYAEIDASEWASTYTGNIDTFSSPYQYVSRSDYDSEIVYEITKVTFEHGKELAKRNQLLKLFSNEENSIKPMNSDIPVHLGAYQYFKEAGIWNKYDLTKPPEAED